MEMSKLCISEEGELLYVTYEVIGISSASGFVGSSPSLIFMLDYWDKDE